MRHGHVAYGVMRSSVTVSPGINFKRDASTGRVAAGECDGSRALPILSAVLSNPTAGVQALRSVIIAKLGDGFLSTEAVNYYTVTRW